MAHPIEDPAAIRSFFSLHAAPPTDHPCRGLACFAARACQPDRWDAACRSSPSVICLGQCFEGPALAGSESRPAIRCFGGEPVLLERILQRPVRSLKVYQQVGGERALQRAQQLSPEALIECIEASGLRGRGGAGFPTGRKWRAVRKSGHRPVVVVNADEGDPGAFSDRFLMEDDPHRLLDATAIAARAIGATESVIYVRCEYPTAFKMLEQALAESVVTGRLSSITIRLVSGEGSFVCGEETSLLNAIEGRRPFVRSRPPYPFQKGLWGRPTLVQNVETLCAAAWIVEHGAEAYRARGTEESAGTKLISLNSRFSRPGLVEIPFGIPLRTIVEEIGGGLANSELLGVMVGGPLAGLLPPEVLDTPFTYADLARVGGAVGHGGIIAFGRDIAIRELVAEVLRFGATESCGLCVPCHQGLAELHEAIPVVIASERDRREQRMSLDASRIKDGCSPLTHPRWLELLDVLELTSLCGHGAGIAEFLRSIERYFGQEMAECFQP